jgi:hypothetical protein
VCGRARCVGPTFKFAEQWEKLSDHLAGALEVDGLIGLSV